MGNTTCLCEKSQIQNAPSLKNSRILEDPQCDQKNDANSNNNSSSNAGNSNKISLKSKNIAKLRQKYGTRNCIDEEDTSSFCDSVYSEMVNNSIYHLSSLISSNGTHTKNDFFDAKNSLAMAAGPNSNNSSIAAAGGKIGNSVSAKSQKNDISSKHKHYQITLDIVIAGIALSNPEGDRIKQGQKVILRHINSEMNLHSHYRKHEKGSKLQEVSACSSRMIHQHDFWIIDTPSNYYENLNQSNRVWAQIGKFQATDDTAASQSNECILGDDSDSYTHSATKFPKVEGESSILKSPYIISSEEVIFKHCATQRELASNDKFMNESSKTQQVFCDELSHNFQIKESFNWNIIVHNSDGYLRDNSIIQIIHSETNRPLRTNKHNGILSNTVEVVCGNKENSAANRQMNDFWIINRVQTNSTILAQLSENENN